VAAGYGATKTATLTVLLRLLHEEGVGQEGARHRDHVGVAGGEHLLRNLRRAVRGDAAGRLV